MADTILTAVLLVSLLGLYLAPLIVDVNRLIKEEAEDIKNGYWD